MWYVFPHGSQKTEMGMHIHQKNKRLRTFAKPGGALSQSG
jgi:hypothetical protein